jgi:hypothetical protein
MSLMSLAFLEKIHIDQRRCLLKFSWIMEFLIASNIAAFGELTVHDFPSSAVIHQQCLSEIRKHTVRIFSSALVKKSNNALCTIVCDTRDL